MEQVENSPTSVTLKTEGPGTKNDCVTRTFAFLFFKNDYWKAEKFLQENLDKKPNKGVHTLTLDNFLIVTRSLKQKKIIGLGNKMGDVHLLSEITNTWTGKPCKVTVGTFLKMYPKGTYFISVRKHAFAIKDGIVYGNKEDAFKLKVPILKAFQIKWI